MFIWSGMGFLVPAIWFLLAMLATETDLAATIPKPESSSLILVVSGVIYWFLGRFLNKKSSMERIYEKTEEDDDVEELKIRKSHSFFFIAIEYWSVISFVTAIFIYYNYKEI